jgi:hypothetical protein
MFLCPESKPHSILLASFWLPNTMIMLKVAGTLRHRYLDCRAASKVFSRPHPNMALYGYSISMTSNVMYSMWGFLGVPNEIGNVITPMGSIP